MIDKYYRRSALRAYGECCEICGYLVNLEAHHIDYQEHQAWEDKLRDAQKNGELTKDILDEAKRNGYDYYDVESRSLVKNDSTRNMSILCGNCHALVHKVNMGKLLLNALKPRV